MGIVVLLKGTALDDHKKKLLEKYLQGTCSPEELGQLYQYLRTSPTDEADRAVADHLWQQRPEERILADEKADAMLSSVFRQKTRGAVYWPRIAAVLGGIALLGSMLYLASTKNNPPVEYATGYGETRTVWLPDSSLVTLNANSSLTYRTDSPQVREVWLEGEAFFEVRRTKTTPPATEPVKFVVHTDNVDIAVLGTAFNVNDRRGTTQVVLQHGKVRLDTKHHESLTMHPGELVELASQKTALARQAVNTDDYITWREHKLLFKRTPIKEVIHILEDYYGLVVELSGEGWDDRKITGSVPTNSQEVFLEVLTESMGIRMTQENNRIVLENSRRQNTVE